MTGPPMSVGDSSSDAELVKLRYDLIELLARELESASLPLEEHAGLLTRRLDELLAPMPLAEAVIDAGAVRFRPMILTAAAVVVGARVILFDPIFQGLAISLMAGEVASLLLSRMTVPILFFIGSRHQPKTGQN